MTARGRLQAAGLVALLAGALGWVAGGLGDGDGDGAEDGPAGTVVPAQSGVVTASSSRDTLVLAGPGEARIRVSGPALSRAPAGAPPAAAGSRWTVVRVTVRNVGAVPYAAENPMTAELRSGLAVPTGTVDAPGCDAAAGARVRLAPGARARLCALFGVPGGDTPATIVFAADRAAGTRGRWPVPIPRR